MESVSHKEKALQFKKNDIFEAQKTSKFVQNLLRHKVT